MNTQAKEYPVTKRQIAAIHTLKAKLGINDDTYQSILLAYGVDSSSKLSFTEAGEMISNFSARLNGKNPTPLPKKKYYGKGKRGQEKNLTQMQAERILILEKLLEWNDYSTFSFLKRQTGKNTGVQMLTNTEASNVIVGMQRTLAGKIGGVVQEVYTYINSLSNNQLRDYKKC